MSNDEIVNIVDVLGKLSPDCDVGIAVPFRNGDIENFLPAGVLKDIFLSHLFELPRLRDHFSAGSGEVEAPKWEYKMIKVNEGFDKNDLNQLGDLRWEMVTFDVDNGVSIFKRPL